jgi:hypothetical protein
MMFKEDISQCCADAIDLLKVAASMIDTECNPSAYKRKIMEQIDDFLTSNRVRAQREETND